MEILEIPGYEGYGVTRNGIIFSDRNNKWGRDGVWRPIKLSRLPTGYLYFRPVVNGVPGKMLFSHVAVLLAFVGPRSNGMHTRHIDGDPGHNELSNLAWGTRKENEADKKIHGRDNVGERHCFHKLQEVDIPIILEMNKNGISHRDIGNIYGVKDSTIGSVVTGKTWKHIRRNENV